MQFFINLPINSGSLNVETIKSQANSTQKLKVSLLQSNRFYRIIPRIIILTLIMMGSIGSLMAQFTGLVNSTESRCIADGTISISGASTTSIYAVTGQGYPQTTQGPGSSSYLFETLPPGNFTVTEFKSDNTEHTFMINVPGNYQQNWQFTANVTFGDCMDGEVGTITIGNFTITNATLAQQRPPYEFRISEPNGVLPANGQGLPEYADVEEFVYPNTVAGSSFQMQARDSCGNFKTYNIQVPSNSPQPNLNFTRLGYENCDGDAEYNFNATGGTAPYLFEVISSTQPGDPLVGMTSTDNPTFWVLQGSTTYVVSVRDECGSIRTRSINVPAYSAPCLSATGAPGNCGDPGDEGIGALVITTCQNGIGPYTLTVVSVGCGYNETFDDVPPSFTLNNLPRPCDYVITITDGCMEQRTINVGLDGPSDASLSCNHTFLCPSSGSELIRLETNVTNGPPYNPTYPLTIDLTSGGISLQGYPKVMTENSGRRNTQSLEPGMYTYLITDACGITCSQTVDVPLYENPTATVDSDQQCYGSGQMIIEGVNGNPLNNSSDIYSIVAGPNFIGKTSESDAPPGTGMFSNLISDGTYTFRYFDGCKEFLLEEQIPTWTQPTYEVGYGLICGDDNSANLNMINLQPEGEVALPYHWILQSTNSNQYAGPLPFPDNVGQTDSVFMDLVPNMNGSTATYFFLGYDNCKNSYQAAGSVGFFPDNELVLSSYSVCPGPDAVVTARVSVPIVGGTYEIFRDGELLVTTTNLFTTIQPALPGLYTARITVLNNDNVECEYITEPVEITAIGELNITDPEGKCPTEGVDLTDPAITAGSSPGVLTYWLDEALTQPLPNPDFVVQAGTYYINLITDGPVSCNLTAPVEVVSISCCPQIFVQSSVVVDANCNEENATIEVTPVGSEFGYIFRWENEMGDVVSTTNTVTNVGPGVYTVYISADLDGCDDETIYVVVVGTLEGPIIEVVEINDENCGDGSGNVTIDISGGESPYEIIWSNGNDSPINENLSEGGYSVTVTDAGGCQEVGYVEIGNGSGDFGIDVTAFDSECGMANGSAEAEAFGEELPVEYLWSTGATTSMIENVPAGVYSVTATDGNGCVVEETVIVTDSPGIGAPEIEIVIVENVSCTGDADGVVEFLPSEDIEYRVFNSEGLLISVGPIATDLIAGTYTVVATDGLGCQTIEEFSISEPSMIFDVFVTGLGDSQCENAGTGFIVIEVVGGTAPYTYLWSGPNGFSSTDMNPTGLFNGEYSLTVTDDNDCVLMAEVEIDVFDTEEPNITLCDLEANAMFECAGEENIQIVEDWHNNNLAELAQCITDDSDFEVLSDYDFTMDQLIDGCSEYTGTYMVNYWAVDDCGFISEEIVLSISLVDTTSPDLSECDLEELSITIECIGDPETQIADWVEENIEFLTNCATDICSEFVVTSNVDDVDFVEGCSETTGEITVTFTVTDECGNEITTDATLTIEDTTAPDLTACDLDALSITVECVGDPESQIADWNAANIATLTNCATDICSEFEVTSNVDDVDFVEGCSETTGEITVTFTITDECGNEITTDATLTIEDTTAPDLTACDLDALSITVECVGDPESQIADWNAANIATLTNCATDICSEFEVTSNVDDVDFIEGCSATTGEITVTFTVTDECGNAISTEATLTIVDTTAPDISNCPNTDLTIECESTENQTNAENWNLANIESLLGCVTDACSETFVVISDFDWDDYITSCGDAGSIEVTYQVVDECGNISDDFVSTLVIEDTAPPVVEILDELFIYNGLVEVECNSNIEEWEYPTLILEEIATSDNCGSVELSLENEFTIAEDCAEAGYMMEHNYLITAIDQCDNVTTVESTLRIVDTTAPEISGVPADITVDCANIPECPGMGSCEDASSELVTSFDNCECGTLEYEEIIVNQTCEYNYTMVRRWTATDKCGNTTVEEQVITVQDETAPELILANPSIRGFENGEEIKVDCEAWGLPEWVIEIDENAVLAVDGCIGEIEVAFTETVEHGFQCTTDGYFDKISYNWTAEDACGNVSEFGFVILLTDNTAPAITGPQTICDPNPENSGLEVSETCSSVISWDFEDRVIKDDCMGEGILREWLAVDACNNMSFFEQHIFEEMPAPIVEVKSEMMPEGTGNGSFIQLNCSDEYMLEEFRKAEVTVDGGCESDLEVIFTEEVQSEVGCEDNILSVVVLRWTATDRCGQEGVYEIFVNLLDNKAPSFFGNAREISFECGEEIEMPKVTDNCSAVDLVLMSQDTLPGAACANDMILEQRFQATDLCGNTSEFRRRVNIYDTNAPEFVSVKEIVCNGDTNEPEVIDGCGGEVELSFQDLAPLETCGNISSVRRVWTARDACGNSTSFEQTVIMSNNYGEIEVMNPFLGKLTENETYKVECSMLPSDIVEAFKPSDVMEFGNCSIVDVNVQVRLNGEGDCSVDGYLYDFNITYTVESECLGKREFSLNVQIVDTTAPVFEYAPEDVEIYCEGEDALEQPILVDDCSDVTVEYKEVRTNMGGDGSDGNYRLVRTWIATDRCGNTSTHTQRVRFYSYELEAEIILMNPPQCNSNRNGATVIIYNGTGPFKYEWTVLSGECEIIGNRFLQTVRYKIGFSPVTLQVKITDSFGCVVTRTITFICTNIEVRTSEDGNNITSAEMVLYPNPTKDRLNLSWKSEKSTSMEFRIYSGVGEIILDKKMIQNEGNNYLEFEISHFAPGIYNLEIIEGSNVAYKRFIVVD